MAALRIIQRLVSIKQLGGGSFWRGTLYLSFGASLALLAIIAIPAIIASMLPDWLLLSIEVVFLLGLLGGLVYVIAAGYQKISNLV